MCHLYINVIRTLNFNIRLCCNGKFYKVNVNLKYPSDFVGMKEIDLNWIFYENIEEIGDEERDIKYTAFENDHEMQKDIGVHWTWSFSNSIFYLVQVSIQCLHLHDPMH